MSALKRAWQSLDWLAQEDSALLPPAAAGPSTAPQDHQHLPHGGASLRAMSSSVSMPTHASSMTLEGVPLISCRTNSSRTLVTDLPKSDVPAGRARVGLEAFLADVRDLFGGTLPVSVVIALTIGVICGVVAWAYYQFLELLLRLLWKTIPERYIEGNPLWPSSSHWMYIPVVGLPMAVLVGLSVHILGEPGDLAYTVGCVHTYGYIATGHVLPMLFASLFSIIGGGSLGPEAPLVAICGSIGGWVSRALFKQRYRNVVRKHTLNGMACALAAFFGVPLGGALFALEINSRLGFEYYEHALESVLSGTTCLIVFRGLTGLPIGPIWEISAMKLGPSTSGIVAIGALIGLMGAAVASLFAHFHWSVMDVFKWATLLTKPVARAVVASLVICGIGVVFPQTMFWGEFEFQAISTLAPNSELTHVWPKSGLLDFRPTGFLSSLALGAAKLLAISFTVAGGYRGGYIFPFFAAGAALGRALTFLFPSIPPQIACLCFAAAINVAITRTALATSLILATLAGEINAGPPVLAASLVSLFATAYMPFIGTQTSRQDVFESVLFSLSEESSYVLLRDEANLPGNRDDLHVDEGSDSF